MAMAKETDEQNRMATLISEITRADTAYYKFDNPIMSDRDYDALIDELKNLEAETGIVLSGSPTQFVAGEISEELKPVQHTKPMRSANKTKVIDDLIQFANGHTALLSWKLDGLSLILRYEHGKYKQAITRGRHGIVGEDVTHTVRLFMNVPLEIPCREYVEVRGEGVVSWENFQRINEMSENTYEHPRNLAAGSVRSLNANPSNLRYMEFFAFDLISENTDTNSKREQLDFLRDNGFSVVPYIYLDETSTPKQICADVLCFQPNNFKYPVDGIVIEQDDISYGKSLGSTEHHDKRLLALKWADKTAKTQFIGVELATTRTGLVSITGLFKPVKIDGSVVQRAYLHTLDIFENFQFGVGDIIEVYKANMIVPKIAKNQTKSNTYQIPMTCPCCGKSLTIRKTDGGTRQLFCENPNCSAKLVQKFNHFCGKGQMNIKGLSAQTLQKFISYGWIKTFADLYDLEKYKDEIIETDDFGAKSYEALQTAIEKSRRCTLQQFICAMGIPLIGKSAACEIGKVFKGDWNAFENAILSDFDFQTLPDFGETMHQNIYQWYSDTDNAELWRGLLEKIEFVKEESSAQPQHENIFSGKTVVVTGKLKYYTREEIQEVLLSLGAKPVGAISKKTDYLIVGENAGSKLKKAEMFNTPVLTEDDFASYINQ